MDTLNLTRMVAIQHELQRKYGKDWIALTPENGHYSVLWAVSEIGEVIDIIKKQGAERIMNDAETRAHFTEEIADVLMFLTDTMICYDITPAEMTQAYENKHAYNMKRWDKK